MRDGNVFTAAGIAAGIDLALGLVEDDLGADVARTAAKVLVALQRPGGQSQFSQRTAAPAVKSEAAASALDAWRSTRPATTPCAPWRNEPTSASATSADSSRNRSG